MSWVAVWFLSMGICFGAILVAQWFFTERGGDGTLFICTSCRRPKYEGKRMVGRINGQRVCLRCWDKAP